jgi:hypothetical protein
MRRWNARNLGRLAIVWTVLVLLILADCVIDQSWPRHTTEWIALVVLGPPAMILVEAFFEVAFGLISRSWVGRVLLRMDDQRFSGLRVLVGVAVVLVGLGVIAGVFILSRGVLG